MDSLRHRLISGGGWALGSKILTAFLNLITNALLSRLLTPQELGSYFLTYSVVFLGASVGTLGLNQAIVRFVAESIGLNQPLRARRAVILVFSLGTLGAIGIALLHVSVGDLIMSRLFNAPALTAVAGLVAGWIAVTVIQRLLSETFRGFHNIYLASIFGGLSTGLLPGLLIVTGLIVLWLWFGEATLATILLLSVGAGFSSAWLGIWMLKGKIDLLFQQNSPITEQQSLKVHDIMRVAWPLLVTNITFFLLTQADLWLAGIFLEQEQVAVYGAAARLVLLVVMPLQIVNAFLPPLIAEMYFQGKLLALERLIRVTATLAGIPAFMVLISFMLAGGAILEFLYGTYYRQGTLVLVFLSFGQLINVWSGACGLTLSMTGYQKVNMIINLLLGVFTVVVGLFAIQFYGIVALAVSVALSRTIQNIVLIILTKKYTGMWTHVNFTLINIRYIKEIFS